MASPSSSVVAEPVAQRPRLWFEVEAVANAAKSNGFTMVDKAFSNRPRPDRERRDMVRGVYWLIGDHLVMPLGNQCEGNCPCYKKVSQPGEPPIFLYRSAKGDGWWVTTRNPLHDQKGDQPYLAWHADVNPVQGSVLEADWHVPASSQEPRPDFSLVPYYEWLSDLFHDQKAIADAADDNVKNMQGQLTSSEAARQQLSEEKAALVAELAESVEEHSKKQAKLQELVDKWEQWWEDEGKHFEESLKDWVQWHDGSGGSSSSKAAGGSGGKGSGKEKEAKTGWFNKCRDLLNAIFGTELEVPKHIVEMATRFAEA
jgi:hypothetical protein